MVDSLPALLVACGRVRILAIDGSQIQSHFTYVDYVLYRLTCLIEAHLNLRAVRFADLSFEKGYRESFSSVNGSQITS